MLSSSNLKSAQAISYFEKDDYYSNEEGPGETCWLGKGADRLGLRGDVEKKAFAQLLNGYSPTGERLFSRQVDSDRRRAATDYTFSAPKSVSVAGLVQGDKRVIAAHHLAVERALSVLEERFAETRIATISGRKQVATGNIAAAVFAHGTSRAAEPQLHSHCVVMNATQIENGKWYSLLNDSAISNKKLLGQLYQNELAVELQKLGYEIEQREHGQFDLKGYSKELLDTFSTRRGQIEALVEDWKKSGKVLRDLKGNVISAERAIYEVAALKTRKAKPQIVEAEKLLQNWQSVLAMKGLTLPKLPSEQNAQAQTAAKTEEQTATVVDDAIAHCAERNAIFEPKQIERFIFENHIGTASVAELTQGINSHPELIDLGEKAENKPIVTTESALQLELATISLMQAGLGQEQAIADTQRVQESFVSTTLSEEQKQAIAISCASTDSVMAWQGSAGAGKTFGLNALKQLAEASGYRVSGYAPSSAAVHELGESLGIQTETVARLLISEPLAEEAEQKQLWIVDEAGLLSMRSAHDLLMRAQTQKARVILVGDTKQLSAVEAGNPFKSLRAGGMQTCHLDEARRQKRVELKRAVELVAAGAVAEGIDVLESAGCISQIAEEDSRIAQVAKDFLSLSADERSETLVLAGTNNNRLALTAEIRAGLQRSGELGANTFTMQSLQRKDLTAVQKRYAGRYEVGNIIVPIQDYKQQQLKRAQHYVIRAINKVENTLALETPDGNLIQINPKECERKSVYTAIAEPVSVGDRLKWTKNNRVKGMRNGQAFTVSALTPGGLARITDDEGNHRDIELRGYQHVDYAWIATTYSAQGKTAERVMALTDRATTNREAFYVATSRAKNELRLYTADIEKLRESANKSRANENVSDYLPLFELAQEQAGGERKTIAADYAREAAKAAGNRARQQQPNKSEPAQPVRAEKSSHISDFNDIPQQLERRTRWVKRQNSIVRLEEALALGGAAQQVQQRAEAIHRMTGAIAQLTADVEKTAQRKLAEREAQTHTPTTQPLFEIAHEYSTTQTPTDYAREAARDAGRCAHDRQRAVARSHRQQYTADSGAEEGATGYVTEFGGVSQRVERHARWRKRAGCIVRLREADLPVDDCAQQIQQRTGASQQVAGAVARLDHQLERAARRRQAERSDRRALKERKDKTKSRGKHWDEYAQGSSNLSGKALDFYVAKNAIADRLSDKEAIALLAKGSDHARKLYKERGSTPAYEYAKSVVKAASRSIRQQLKAKQNGCEI